MRSVLITGGTGSFGKSFLRTILSDHPEFERIVIYSRDELKQWEIASTLSSAYLSRVRFFIGDIRDLSRLSRAMNGITDVVHAAALKQVPAAEYNPFEFIKTNVIGTQNVVTAAIDQGVKRVISLSTDKAAAPVNLYGATKLCSDKLVIAANNTTGSADIRLSVVRYGNVFGSRGSVVPYFLSQKDSGILTVTDPSMTRFSISLQEGVDLVIDSLNNCQGSEIIVPIIPSYRILELATAIAPNAKIEIIGRRPGEKLHEEMITSSDSGSTFKLHNKYIIYPHGTTSPIDSAVKVSSDFTYNSLNNDRFLTVDDIQAQLSLYQDHA